jgi:radical SAM superfamily enzyme YgiQ (UPF0313 family)
MRIALIQACSNFYRRDIGTYEPIGLCYLKAVARADGHDARIFHQADRDRISDQLIVDRVVRFAPDLVGFSSMTENLGAALRILDALRARHSAPVVFGGIHASFSPELAGRDGIDYVVMGEGEKTFAELIRVAAGEHEPEQVAGLAYMKDGEVRINPARERIDDLDALPWADRDGLPRDMYRFYGDMEQGPEKTTVALVHSSRGCNFRCSFCTSPTGGKGRWIPRSPERVVKEIEQVVSRYESRFVMFADEDLAQDADRAKRLFQLIRDKKIRFGYGLNARASSLDGEMIRLMRQSGCRWMSVGIESSSEDSRKRLKKRLDGKTLQENLRMICRSGIQCFGNIIIGFPWDDARALENEVQAIRRLEIDFMGLNFFTPFPGTELTGVVREKGLIEDENLEHHNAHMPVCRTEHLSRTQLSDYAKRINRAFYLRPKYIKFLLWRILRDPKRLLGILRLIYFGIKKDRLSF